MTHLTALILAAGRSSRLAEANKLLLPLGERTILEHVVTAVCAAAFPDVIVVTGHDAGRVGAVLPPYPVRVVHNPAYAAGMASSLRCGVEASRDETAGYLVALGDMPFVAASTFERLHRAFGALAAPAILVAATGGRRGNPVAFHRAYREALLALEGDVGARSVVRAHPGAVVEVDVDDPAIFEDIDTPLSYDRARSSRG